MSYRPKKYVYMVLVSLYGRLTVGMYATKADADRYAAQYEKETNLTVWVERYEIQQPGDDEMKVRRYD